MKKYFEAFKAYYKKYPSFIWTLIILPIFGAIVYHMGESYEKDLKENARYTIATTTEVYYAPKNGKQVGYFYFVNGKKHTSSAHYENDCKMITVGNRYVVRFSSKHYKHSQLLCYIDVPDSVTEAPADGWEVVPF